MSERKIPEFSSPELHAAMNEVLTVLVNADHARAKVTADINALERFLQGMEFHKIFRFPMSLRVGDLSLEESAAHLEGVRDSQGSCLVAVESILWSRNYSHEPGRLQYECATWVVSYDVKDEQSFSAPDRGAKDAKRTNLTECEWAIRKELHARLPEFLKAFAVEF